MTATIRTNRTLFDVYGTLQEVAPILAWIADQAPSAHLKFDADGDEQRVTQWFEFTVWFDEDTDEVNFKMFQSEAFEAQAQAASQPSLFGRITSSNLRPGMVFNTWSGGQATGSQILDDQGYVTGIKRGGK